MPLPRKFKKKPTGGPGGMGGPPRQQPREDNPPGGFNYGSYQLGGPLAFDAFGARPAPTPFDLIERYKSLVYAMAARNRDAVMRTPLRLYCDGSRRILGGKPRHVSDPVQVSRRWAERLVRDGGGRVSPGAVDNIYEIRNHGTLDVLDKPDPYGCFTRRKLIGLMVSYNDIIGYSYLVPEGNGWDYRTGSIGKGPPEHLWVIFPQYTVPYFDGSSPIPLWWQYFRDYIPFDNVLWFRQSCSLRNPYGTAYSPAYAGTTYAESEDRFMTVLDQALGLSPIPAVVVTAKDATQPPGLDEARRLKQDFMRQHAGGNSSGGLYVNNGAWEFTTVQRPPTDLGAKEVSEYDRNCLAAIFGQPPTYYTTDTNLANLQAADEHHAKFGVEPRCWAIAETLTHFVQQFDRRLFFAFDAVLVEDELKRAQVDKLYVDMGAVTVNQLNEEKKYPPAPWGNEPMFSRTMLPYSMLVSQAQQAMDSQKASMENEAAMTQFQTTPEDAEAIEDEAADEGAAARALTLQLGALAAEVMRSASA